MEKWCAHEAKVVQESLRKRRLACLGERWAVGTSVGRASQERLGTKGARQRERERDPLVVSDQVQLASSSVLLFLVVRPGAPSSEPCPETEIVSVKDES